METVFCDLLSTHTQCSLDTHSCPVLIRHLHISECPPASTSGDWTPDGRLKEVVTSPCDVTRSDQNGGPLILSDKNRGNVDSTCHEPVIYDVTVNNCYI